MLGTSQLKLSMGLLSNSILYVGKPKLGELYQID